MEHKGYSIFRLISGEEYACGLAALRRDFERGATVDNNHGETYIRLVKQAPCM